MESFFHTLKAEAVHGHRFEDETQLRLVSQEVVEKGSRGKG
jgi:hypothetical protein